MGQQQSGKEKALDHNVYDAASRGVLLPLHTIPHSLVLTEEQTQFEESKTRVKREDINFAGKKCAESRGWILRELFTADECDALVQATESTATILSQ